MNLSDRNRISPITDRDKPPTPRQIQMIAEYEDLLDIQAPKVTNREDAGNLIERLIALSVGSNTESHDD